MDKKTKKKIDVLNQRLSKLRQQLAGMRKQTDEPEMLRQLEHDVASAEAELAVLKKG